MLPLYRDGDHIVVSPNEQVRRGDRVVVKNRDGEVMVKILSRQTANLVELAFGQSGRIRRGSST